MMTVRHAPFLHFKVLLCLGVVSLGLFMFIFTGRHSVTRQAVTLIQKQGVLDVQVEYYQAQLGLSLLRGGEFRPLKTTYEWWLDAANPHRFRRATIEWLDDSPHLVGADGSDGINAWWEVDWMKGITTPAIHEGLYPGSASTFEEWTSIFWADGQKWLEQARTNKAQVISQSEEPQWGKVMVIKQVDPTGHTVTATVRVDDPTILIERVVVDRDGKPFETERITIWQWLDTKRLNNDFWMAPPKDIHVGP